MMENHELERLMNEYGDSIFRICFLYLKDYQLAEDAVQETYVKAFINYDRFKHMSSEKTWLTRIAINCCKNIMRTHWFQIIKNDIEEYRMHNVYCATDDSIQKESISAAIMKLSLDDRKIIILYYYQELSVKDIASIIGISENTVNQRLFRARKKLKKYLEEEGLVYDC